MFKHFNNPFVVWPRPHAHNLFLHITSEVGIVGLLFFILFIFNVLFSCIKNYRNTDNPQSKISSLFLFIAISGFFFNNLTEYNWEHPLFQVLFYFLTSIIFVIKRFLKSWEKRNFLSCDKTLQDCYRRIVNNVLGFLCRKSFDRKLLSVWGSKTSI